MVIDMSLNSFKNGLKDFGTGFRYGGVSSLADILDTLEVVEERQVSDEDTMIYVGHYVRSCVDSALLVAAPIGIVYCILWDQDRLGMINKDFTKLDFKRSHYVVRKP